ncbi:ABC transporter permease [Nocardiopsis akebiae]|uniref:ABC transporter permease n=1 Tax=Nocardiopsis akebiae TaxID=2831968 RepID=A0ABX8BZZ8_9ACTN|nr:ABC transporter permease [Nocardiopsis akebiae]QUX27633.1 ABC transporter permease [Nocardiopsis akebiae]
MNTLVKLTTVETKLLTREPGAVFTLLIPLFILVVFGSSISEGDTVLVPTALTIAIGLVGLYMLPTSLATYRERGILRRLSTTPVRPENMLAVQLLLQFALIVATAGLLIGVGVGVLGARMPRVTPFLTVFLLGTAAMFAVGMLIASLAPNGRSANGVGVLLYFPLAYLGGLMQPADQLPAIVARIGEYTPFGAVRQSFHDIWSGAALQPPLLAAMAAYAVVLSLVATRFFRWE